MAKRRPVKLRRSFFNRDSLRVARDLLGKSIVYRSPVGEMSARIVETEAYIGQTDRACHAAPGLTDRNRVIFGPPGYAYIYLIYGMYHCLNVVTEKPGFPAAVLIRAAEVRSGGEYMTGGNDTNKSHLLLSGPGKLCRAFGLTRDLNGLDFCSGTLFLTDDKTPVGSIGRSPRVGVTKSADKQWRFFDLESESVSKYRAGQTKPSRPVKRDYLPK